MAKDHFVISHWNTLLDHLSESPQRFYECVEMRIRERHIPEIKLGRATIKEGGIFSAKREYFSATRRNFTFHICGAPFGNGFFVSWWYSFTLGFWQRVIVFLSKIPWFDEVLPAHLTQTATFYQHDTTEMYQNAIHRAVLEVIDDLTKVKGLRALSELERKPITTELFEKQLSRVGA